MGISATEAIGKLRDELSKSGGVEAFEFVYSEGADALREHLHYGVLNDGFDRLSADEICDWVSTLISNNQRVVYSRLELVLLAVLLARSRRMKFTTALSTKRLLDLRHPMVKVQRAVRVFQLLSRESSENDAMDTVVGVMRQLVDASLVTLVYSRIGDIYRPISRDGTPKRQRIPGRNSHLAPESYAKLTHPLWMDAVRPSSMHTSINRLIEMVRKFEVSRLENASCKKDDETSA